MRLAIHKPGVRTPCKEAGITPSMGSVGDCYDHSMAASFFATLGCELLDQQPTFRNRTETRLAVFDVIATRSR